MTTLGNLSSVAAIPVAGIQNNNGWNYSYVVGPSGAGWAFGPSWTTITNTSFIVDGKDDSYSNVSFFAGAGFYGGGSPQVYIRVSIDGVPQAYQAMGINDNTHYHINMVYNSVVAAGGHACTVDMYATSTVNLNDGDCAYITVVEW